MIFIYICTFILGAAVGSFLNVCIYRLPRAESIISPSSHCPNCKKPIPWYDNIPLLSYILLGRRCRFCKMKISFRYFVVEGLTAIMFVLLLREFGISWFLLIYAALFSGLIIISFVDMEHWIIPDEVTIPGTAVGILLSVIYPALQSQVSRIAAVKDSFFGAVFGIVSLFVIGIIGKFAYKKEAMGGGDLKLLMFIGSFLGLKLTVVTFFLASILGSIVGLPKLIRKQETIQYGPFLAMAAFVCILFKEKIFREISNLF